MEPQKPVVKPATFENITPSTSFHASNPFDITQLRAVMTEVLTTHRQQMSDRHENTTRTLNDADQNIDPRYLTDLDDMDRIPDVVKSLREFSGQPGEFSSWRKSVERILKFYGHLKGTPKYYGMLSVIRNKITGQADTALESYNTPLSWEKISQCLTLHYADKRDLGTLEYQMTTLVQKNNSIHEFYQMVYQHLSLILNKLSSMEMTQESMNVMTQAYRDKALDTFIRGLRGDLPRLLSMRGPIDLPEALHLCLKLENVQFRVQYSQGNINMRNPQFSQRPPLPPRKPMPMQPRQPFSPPMRDFYPELLHNPQPLQGPYKPNPHYQHPFANRQTPRPPWVQNRNYLSRPEPMDVDPSIRSKQVNYQNRPPMNQFVQKRPYSNQVHQPAKFQRIYHAEPQQEYPDIESYNDQMNEYDVQYDQTMVEYTNSMEYPPLTEQTDNENLLDEPIQIEELDDVHFLV